MPDNTPPQVPPTAALNPLPGVTVNVGVAPLATLTGVDGEVVPVPLATDGVMVRSPAMVVICCTCGAALKAALPA